MNPRNRFLRGIQHEPTRAKEDLNELAGVRQSAVGALQATARNFCSLNPLQPARPTPITVVLDWTAGISSRKQ